MHPEGEDDMQLGEHPHAPEENITVTPDPTPIIRPIPITPAFKVHCPRPLYPTGHPLSTSYSNRSSPFYSTPSSPFTPLTPNTSDDSKHPLVFYQQYLARIGLSITNISSTATSSFTPVFIKQEIKEEELEEEESEQPIDNSIDNQSRKEDRYPWLEHYNRGNNDTVVGAVFRGRDICAICNDRSSGLHYGIFTCEGCKGFFKRTVQNKRRYSCANSANRGSCTVTKERRNRCQYCRFLRCLDEGMVLEAVREDRTPGGRNGAAIYSVYRSSHRRRRMNPSTPSSSSSTHLPPPPPLSSSLSPSSVSPPSSPPSVIVAACQSTEDDVELEDRGCHKGTTKNLIEDMISIDRIDRLINLNGLRIRSVRDSDDSCKRLSRIGDEIVEQLVEWTKQLPFYSELPIEVHTHLLTQRWAELVLLSACFYAVSTMTPPTQESSNDDVSTTTIDEDVSLVDQQVNIRLLQRRLSIVMGREIPIDHVEREAGPLVDKFTALLYTFSRLRLNTDAYVCLKAITLLNFTPPVTGVSMMRDSHIRKVQLIQDQFVKALQIQLIQEEDGGARLSDILTWLPLLHSASSHLLHSKMFYVPFLICKCPEPIFDS